MEKEAEAVKSAPSGVPGAVDYGAPPSYQAGAPPVVFQPQQTVIVPDGNRPDDYFVMSIITIFCCFWPLGIIALLKSIETRGHNDRGDYESARATSRQALLFNKLAILVGVITLVVVFIIQIAWVIPVVVIAATANYDGDK